MKSTKSELHRLTAKVDKLKKRPVVLDLLLLFVVILIAIVVEEIVITFLKGALR